MKTLIGIILASCLVFASYAQPNWVSSQKTPTNQSRNSKIIGCKSTLPGYYKNIDCLTNWLEEQLNIKSTPQFPLAQTFRVGADYQMPEEADGSWGLLGPYYMGQRADTYDNALAAILLINAGKLDQAKKICDTFVLLVEFDSASDGRARSAYDVDDPINRAYNPDITTTYAPNVVDNTVTTGSMAYMILALTRFYVHSNDYKYLRTAIKIARCIDTNFQYSTAWGGYTGGFTDTNGQDLPVTWRSISHNADVFAAARMLYGLTGDLQWQGMMNRTQTYVKQLYDNQKGFYYMGSPPMWPHQDFILTNMAISADGQTWNSLSEVDPDLDRKKRSLQFVWDSMYRTETQVDDVTGKAVDYDGVKFSNQGSAIQFEQSASAAMAFHQIGSAIRFSDPATSQRFLDAAQSLIKSLIANQQYAVNGDGHGIVAAVNPSGAKAWNGNDFDGTTWTFYPVQHTAASAWAGLAIYYVMYDDQFANPYAEYYKKPVPSFFGSTVATESGAIGNPPRSNQDIESFAIGTTGLVITCIFAVILIGALIVMAGLNLRLVKKNYMLLGDSDAHDVSDRKSVVLMSPIDRNSVYSPATPATPSTPVPASPLAE